MIQQMVQIMIQPCLCNEASAINDTCFKSANFDTAFPLSFRIANFDTNQNKCIK